MGKSGRELGPPYWGKAVWWIGGQSPIPASGRGSRGVDMDRAHEERRTDSPKRCFLFLPPPPFSLTENENMILEKTHTPPPRGFQLSGACDSGVLSALWLLITADAHPPQTRLAGPTARRGDGTGFPTPAQGSAVPAPPTHQARPTGVPENPGFWHGRQRPREEPRISIDAAAATTPGEHTHTAPTHTKRHTTSTRRETQTCTPYVCTHKCKDTHTLKHTHCEYTSVCKHKRTPHTPSHIHKHKHHRYTCKGIDTHIHTTQTYTHDTYTIHTETQIYIPPMYTHRYAHHSTHVNTHHNIHTVGMHQHTHCAHTAYKHVRVNTLCFLRSALLWYSCVMKGLK